MTCEEGDKQVIWMSRKYISPFAQHSCLLHSESSHTLMSASSTGKYCLAQSKLEQGLSQRRESRHSQDFHLTPLVLMVEYPSEQRKESGQIMSYLWSWSSLFATREGVLGPLLSNNFHPRFSLFFPREWQEKHEKFSKVWNLTAGKIFWRASHSNTS